MAHSDEKYQCEEMSDCPYTGTTLINKIPWGDWPAWPADEYVFPESDDSDSPAEENKREEKQEENKKRRK